MLLLFALFSVKIENLQQWLAIHFKLPSSTLLRMGVNVTYRLIFSIVIHTSMYREILKKSLSMSRNIMEL